MSREVLLYTLGVLAAAAACFLCPLWYLGFVPLSAGLLVASYQLVEVDDGANTARPPRR